MKLTYRFAVALSVILVGLIIQGMLFAHLKAARDIPPGKLTNALAAFPMELENWRGKDMPIKEEERYATEHFQRAYVDTQTGQQLTLWMVYSDIGEDRSHHPEICFQVAGQQEDIFAREFVEVEGHEQPVQQMRFRGEKFNQYVYYWHYTLPSPPVEGLTELQKLYKQLRRRPASLTLQVFAPEMSEQTTERAIEFVKLADAAIQDFVGPEAVRGCDRLPVTLIEGTPTADE